MVDKVKEIQLILKKAYDNYFIDGPQHCKSSEGYISIFEEFPVYWEYNKKSKWLVCVYSYVFGPSRMHEFKGKTKDEALDKALKAVKKWIKDDEKENR